MPASLEQWAILVAIEDGVRLSPVSSARWVEAFRETFDLDPLDVTNAINRGRGLPELTKEEAESVPLSHPTGVLYWRDAHIGTIFEHNGRRFRIRDRSRKGRKFTFGIDEYNGEAWVRTSGLSTHLMNTRFPYRVIRIGEH